MFIKQYIIIVTLSCLCFVNVFSTSVNVCPSDTESKVSEESEVAPLNVDIKNCIKPPCKLPKKSTQYIEAKFTPSEDVEKLVNSVQASIIPGVPLPFFGVDGTSVCSKVFLASDGSKVDCPLKAGTEYIYKDQFDVLEIYPKIRATVHWALKSGKTDVLCFEVRIKIV